MVIINNIEYQLSERKNKKLKAFVNGKWVHFGDKRYTNYYDKTGLLNGKYDHFDEDRRYRYLQRSTNIKDKNNNLTMYDITSPNYHSIRVLWL
jgi:hypothetical protein